MLINPLLVRNNICYIQYPDIVPDLYGILRSIASFHHLYRSIIVYLITFWSPGSAGVSMLLYHLYNRPSFFHIFPCSK